MPVYEKNSKIIENRIKKETLLPKIDSVNVETKTKLRNKNFLFGPIFVFQIFVCFFVILFFLIIRGNSYDKSTEILNRVKSATDGPTVSDAVNNIFINLNNFFYNLRQPSNSNQSNVYGVSASIDKKEDIENKKELTEKEAVKQKDEYKNLQEDKYLKNTEVKDKTEYNNNLKDEKYEEEAKEKVMEEKKDESKSNSDTLNFKEPVKGYISSCYGLRKHPVLKKEDFHHGIDIVVKDGTPVVAIEDGVVKQSSNTEKSGNFISIEHKKDYESVYAHCSKILASKGKSVKKGEVIAFSGHTGKNITGPHLHFGLKKNGSWVDPVEIFPKIKTRML